MAGVNGIEIKVGQVWRMRNGNLTAPLYAIPNSAYPFGDATMRATWTDTGVRYLEDDSMADTDLIELVKDENGFTIWRGGEQPAETRDAIIEFKVRRGDVITHGSDGLYWDHRSLPGDIVAYKVLARKGPTADSTTLAEETLSALGWTFDGQAWVEQQKADLPIGMVEGDDREYTGGSVSYYKVPVRHPTSGGEPYDAECNDLIEALGMNFAEGNAFKAIWRLCAARRGLSKRGYDEGVYDAEKVVFFGQRMVVQQKEGGA